MTSKYLLVIGVISVAVHGKHLQGKQVYDAPFEFPYQYQNNKPLILTGTVTDANQNPLQEANVAVVAELPAVSLRGAHFNCLGEVTADQNGTFSVTMASLPLYQIERLTVIARKAGYGMGLVELEVASLHHRVVISLDKEMPISGQVIDPNGKPVTGVKVHLRLIHESWPEAPKHTFPIQISSCIPDQRPAAWPEPQITDEKGRFVLMGIRQSKAERLAFQFFIDDPRFAPFDPDLMVLGEHEEQFYEIHADSNDVLTLELESPRFEEGIVIAKDTKEPIADAWLCIAFSESNPVGDLQHVGIWVKTDKQGRFSVRGRPRRYMTIYVYPPIGLPYPPWVHGGIKRDIGKRITVEVPRGILVRGKVIDEVSGVGIAGARLEYHIRRENTPVLNKDFSRRIYWAAEYYRVTTGTDGRFQYAVANALGHFMVKAPTPAYINRYITHGQFQYDQAGGFWYVADGITTINPKSGMDAMNVTIALRRGLDIHGMVLDPKGEPVDKAVLLTPSYPRSGFNHNSRTTWRRPVTKGRFNLEGCDPGKNRRVYIFDADENCGASIDLDVSKAMHEPPNIRLQPCGSLNVRFVDQNRQPWANVNPPVSIRLIYKKCPVNSVYLSPPRHLDWGMRMLAPSRYRNLRTDLNGHINFPAIIPNAPYTLVMGNREIDFTVNTDKVVDLGDITINR